MHRSPIAKQGSRLVRWAAVKAMQRTGKRPRIGAYRDRVGQRRGRNIGVVAATRELVELVSYVLRDGTARRNLSAGARGRRRASRLSSVYLPFAARFDLRGVGALDMDRSKVFGAGAADETSTCRRGSGRTGTTARTAGTARAVDLGDGLHESDLANHVTATSRSSCPTILELLGLDPKHRQAVRADHTTILPGI